MAKIELQEIIDVCEASESEYLKLYRPLLGYEDEVSFNVGIDDTLEAALNKLEEKVGIEVAPDFLQIYLISNGGKYFDVNLFPLTKDNKDKEGLLYQNFDSGLREEFDVPANTIILGDTDDDELILLGVDEEGYYYYCTWDKDNKEQNVIYDYLLEILMYEIDYHTNAFSTEEE